MSLDGNNSSDGLVKEAEHLLRELFPICRSITGNGVRQTLSRLQKVVEFDVKEIPTGTICYDWVVPDEWNINDAYIQDLSGKKIADFKKNNLHLVSYSIPVNKVISFQELLKHLHTLPQLPNAIPYRVSYYNKEWGFCLSFKEFNELDKKKSYHVIVDSTLKPGSLTYGEYCIKGSSEKEFLIWTYCCHPSLANDNLSGMVLWALLLRELKFRKTRHSYRFVIAPETIGAITYLSQNEEEMKNIYGGFILTCVAGSEKFSYKSTFLKEHEIDRVVDRVFRESNIDYISYPFDVNGSDERQFSSPYFRIPIGTVCRGKYYEYDYYHTSLDNLDYINSENLIQTFRIYLRIIDYLENNLNYVSLNQKGEPMFGKRNLYTKIGGPFKQKAVNKEQFSREYDITITGLQMEREFDAMRWLIFYGDGKNTLLDISEKTDIPLETLHQVAKILREKGLLEIK